MPRPIPPCVRPEPTTEGRCLTDCRSELLHGGTLWRTDGCFPSGAPFICWVICVEASS